ncbi:MAG: histidine--tRNA ligase [Bacillota bacterium]
MINIPKGTKDVLPNESYKWHYIEKVARETAREFGAREIRTPIFEHTELFLRGVGDTTDIVNKEMYTFQDKGDRSITLKPEGTAGVGRSFIENSLYSDAMPLKMYYFTPVFRYEKPQQGRLREHHQFGAEFYGSPSPSMDAEAILLASTFFKKLGVTNLSLKINSIGCKHCREKYNKALKDYFKENLPNMCGTCGDRFEKNPLRILDCKNPDCIKINENAPSILDYICEDCKAHFESLKGYLDGIIEYEIDPRIVRGLDYYSKTVFEFVSENIGAKGTVCGGGRYDGLIEILGGKPNHAVGFGLGLERLLLLLESCNIQIEKPADAEIYIVATKEEKQLAIKLAQSLRSKGFATEYDHMERSFKAQFKYANKLSASFVCIIGGEEAENGGAKVKNMQTGEEKFASFAEIENASDLAELF